jgi:hypothetical protein
LRKIVTILLLIVLFLSQVGYYFLYSLKRLDVQSERRDELKAGVPVNTLSTIILEENSAAIKWEEKGEEFYLDGILYDVASINKTPGKTYLYCLTDQNEQQLMKNVVKAVKSGNDTQDNERSSKHTIKFQFSDYIVTDFEKLSHSGLIPQRKYSQIDASLISSYKSVDIHPPQA